MKLLPLESLCVCSESLSGISVCHNPLSKEKRKKNQTSHNAEINELPGHVHVHNIQINVQKQDRVSATEVQLPAGGP